MCSYRKKQIKNPFPETVKSVALTSLASAPDRKKISRTVAILNDLGINTVVPESIFTRSGTKGLPVSAEIRLKAFYDCWLDNSVDMIISSRGGYGSAQLLDYLDWKKLSSRNIPLLGYSDITALHLAMVRKNIGIPVAAPMGEDFLKIFEDESTFISFEKNMSKAMKIKNDPSAFAKRFDFFSEIPDVFKQKIKVLKKGKVVGRLLPVNLSVFVSLIGTPYMPDLKGCLVIIEDISEPLYVIDRQLTQLLQAGILGKIGGLAFGQFRKCGNAAGRKIIFAKFASYCHGPVIYDVPFGHVLKSLSFLVGEKVVLEV